MEILRDRKQIYEKLAKVFDVDASYFENANFIFESAPVEVVTLLSDKVSDKVLNKAEVEEVLSLIFQMNNFVTLIGNLVKALLASKQFAVVYFIVSKLFLAHFGEKEYKTNISLLFSERNFDRFMEIVINCDISQELYVPFLVEIYKCERVDPYFVWKRPAVECLKEFWKDNAQWFINFINQNPNFRYNALGAVLEFSPQQGVEFLVNDYINNSARDEQQSVMLVKHFQNEILMQFDEIFQRSAPDKKLKLLDILFDMESTNEVLSKLKQIYNATSDGAIKAVISTKLYANENLRIKTEKQFLNAVRNRIEKPQERIYSIPFDKLNVCFKSGSRLNNGSYTFIIQLFKEEKDLGNLKNNLFLENIIDKDGLVDMVHKLYDYASSLKDVLEVKWVWRFVALLGDKQLDELMLNFVEKLFEENRGKEANYLKKCLLAAEKFTEEDLQDINLPKVLTPESYEAQRKKLFEQFIAGKFYSVKNFDRLFLRNPIYNKLAQNLIFGEYRFGTLCSAFHLIDQSKSFIVGESILDENENKNFDVQISIIHPLDCDFKFEKIFHYFASPTFKQFKRAQFNVNEYAPTNKCVARFSGVVVNTEKFCETLEEFGFIANKPDDVDSFDSLIFIFEAGNIICQVCFEKEVNHNTNYSTISGVYFYELNQTECTNNVYVLNKENALPITSVGYRFFDYILSIIFEASKL